jgi:hypothetical protein
MVRITFDVDNPSVSFAAGMHNDTAANGAIGTDGKGLLGILGLEHLGMDFNRSQVKSQAADGKTGSRGSRDLDKLPSVYLHSASSFVEVLSCLEAGLNKWTKMLLFKNKIDWLR